MLRCASVRSSLFSTSCVSPLLCACLSSASLPHRRSCRRPLSLSSLPSTNCPSASIAPRATPSTVHGTNLLRRVSRARVSHVLEWSEGPEVAEETDPFSLTDPHYDLTTAKLTKLFARFEPNGSG